MAINEQVYGAKNTWFDTYFYDKFYHNKKANFTGGATTLKDGVTAGKLQYTEPIDKSLSYCGLGTESALSHLKVVDVSNSATRIVDTIDRIVTNFGFFEIAIATGISGYYSYSQLNEMKEYRAWQENTDDNEVYWSVNKNKILCPYTLIHPKSVVFVINVRAYNSNDQYNDFTLDEYRTAHTSYPRISQVTIEPFMNNPNAFSENQPTRTATGGGGGSTLNDYKKGFIIGLLDEYKLENKNFDMYSYYLSNERLVMGNVTDYKVRNRNTAVSMAYVPDNAAAHFVHDLSDGYIRCYIEYYDGVIDDILKTVACFGLYFTEKTSVAETGTFTNNDMYIGLLDENGIGHGLYLRGADTVNAPQNEFDDMSQSGYDYTKEVDKTKYRNDTQFNTNLSLGAFTKFYQLTESQVNDLCTALYTAVNAQPTGTPIEEYNMKCFLTNNPIDCIISLKKFPLNHFPILGIPNSVYLGTVDTGINAPRVLSTTWIYYFDFSNSNDTGLFPVNGGDFRDYEPCTTVQINVPFCGSFEVPTTYFYKYGGVRVALMIDFISGACTAYLMVNNNVVDSVSGSCAVDLPVTGLQSATLDGNIHSAAMSEKSAQTSGTLSMVAGAVSIGAGIVTGNPLLAIGGVTALVGGATSLEKNQTQIDYELEHMQLPLKQVGAASGAIAQCGDYRCKMVIKRPVMLNYDNEVYAKTIGFACLLNGSVSNFHGLTYGEIDLSNINCSESEKEMIKSSFASGVYLP